MYCSYSYSYFNCYFIFLLPFHYFNCHFLFLLPFHSFNCHFLFLLPKNFYFRLFLFLLPFHSFNCNFLFLLPKNSFFPLFLFLLPINSFFVFSSFYFLFLFIPLIVIFFLLPIKFYFLWTHILAFVSPALRGLRILDSFCPIFGKCLSAEARYFKFPHSAGGGERDIDTFPAKGGGIYSLREGGGYRPFTRI